MADLPPSIDSGRGSDDDSFTGMPRWVKVLGMILLVLVLAFVLLHLFGGGFRGHSMP